MNYATPLNSEEMLRQGYSLVLDLDGRPVLWQKLLEVRPLPQPDFKIYYIKYRYERKSLDN